MTTYTETIGKNTNWGQAHGMQTGLLPALPAIGSVISTVGGALSLGTIGSKLLKALKLGKSGAAKAGSALGGGTGVTLAKAGLGTYALSEVNKFMNSGPEIGGVNIIPVAVVGGVALLGGQMMLGDGSPMMLILPIAGAGILLASGMI